MKNIKRIFCLVLVLAVMSPMFLVRSNAASTGDLLRFVPTQLKVTTTSTTVEGYFINMNTTKSVSNFEEFTMDVFYDGTLVLSGDFGTINKFTVQPLGMKFQSFTYNGDYTGVLKSGTYVADEFYYTTFGCSFTSRTV